MFTDEDNQSVSVQIELKDLENLIERAQRCAEDLVAEVERSNPGNDPVTIRRRERDLTEARWLLSAIPALKVKYNYSAW